MGYGMSDKVIDPDNTAIIGAGTMGHGIAATFAMNGYQVSLYDIDESQLHEAEQQIMAIADRFYAEGRLNQQDHQTLDDRIFYHNNLAAAAESATLVIEAVSEDIELKKEIFSELDRLTDDAILASNTSGFSITEIASVTQRPSRVVGTHWFNPPHIVPLVEVVKGTATDDRLASDLVDFLDSLGKTAVAIEKDIPGYIGNRIQMAMSYEAFSLLADGVASAQDIDKAVKAGFGFRLPVLGIFEKVDQSGIEVHHAVESYLMEDLNRGTDPNPVVSQLVEEGHYGVKTGHGVYDWTNIDSNALETQRDEELLRLLDVYEEDLDQTVPKGWYSAESF